MQVTWILERDVFSEKCFDEMVDHFKLNDIPYHIVRIIPFIHEIEGIIPKVDGDCVVYGSVGIHKLAQAQGWTPGVWTNPMFNEDIIVNRLEDRALNYFSTVMKMSKVEQFTKLAQWSEFFIKPNTDTKEFAGIVISSEEFGEWYQNMINIGYLENNDFDVILAPPRKLGMEWRLVVLDGKVIECSIYKQWRIVKPERQMNKEVIDFVEECVAIHNPADVFVIDVADTEEGLKIIEYNTFNSAGLYDCDVVNIIDRINSFIK